MRTFLPLCLLLAACAGHPKSAGEAEAPEPVAGFVHEAHQGYLADPGCMVCHAASSNESAPEDPNAWTAQPGARALCHRCHREADLFSARKPCSTCHQKGLLPPPTSHDSAWVRGHGRDADLAERDCMGCHLQRDCVQCHVRRDTVGQEVHPGSWLTLHGIEARTQLSSCETCHEAGTCLSCHGEGEEALPW